MRVKGHESLAEGRAALAKMMTAHWFVEHGKQFVYAAVAIAVLMVFLFSWNKRFTGNRSDYLKMQAAFSTWAAQEKHDLVLFKEVSEPLNRHPELAAKFGTLIAQRLLVLGEAKLAQEYGQAALKRTKALLCPYHAQFSQNTLLISQGRLKEALEAAYGLKTQMTSDEALWKVKNHPLTAGRALFAYNLLRIASLEREAGSLEGEKAAWDEVLRNSGWDAKAGGSPTYDPEAFKMLSENFQSGEVSLLDYINQRKKG
jgi:hypothetical protein